MPGGSNATFRLVGRVIDERQQPVEGASVRLVPGPLKATTDHEGAFSFESLAAAQYTLSATKDDLCTPPVQVGQEDAHAAVVLQTRLGSSFIVRTFADRKPVEGARVMLAGGYAATADANGTAIVRGLAPRSYRGRLTAEGFADESLMLSVQADPGGVIERDFTLRQGASIEGVVLDAQGDPIRDARVSLVREADSSIAYETWTESDGRWRVVALRGRYRVVAQSREHGQNANTFTESDGRVARTGIEIRLGVSSAKKKLTNLVSAAKRLVISEKPTRIEGVVVDKNGVHAVGALVSVAEPGQEGRSMHFSRWQGETDARGRFTAVGLDASEYEVSAGWPKIEWPHGKLATQQRVQTGETNARLVLPTGGTISGRALLEGKPLPYYAIAVTTPQVLGGLPIGVRSEDGRFSLPHITPGPWQVVVMGPGTRRKSIDSVNVEDDQNINVGDIELEPGQRVEGIVRDASGSAVAGARVFIGMWTRLAVDQRSQIQQWFNGHFETIADEHGRYVFAGVDAHWRPRPPNIWAEHYSAGSSVIRELATSDSSVDLTLLGAGNIEGVIQGMRGGVPMALAVRDDEPNAARMSRVLKDGSFRFEALPPGDYVIKLTVSGEEPVSDAPVSVVDGATITATLVMNTTSVELVVVVPSGRGKDLVIEPTSADAKIGGNIRSIFGMGTADQCTLSHVRPGEYRMSLDGESWTSVTVSDSPEKQTVDIRPLF